MPKGKSFDDIINEAEQIARVWTENPTFTLGDITLEQFKAAIDTLRANRNTTNEQRTSLTAAVNDANAQAVLVTGLITRARSGIRAAYGPDSTQYDQAGGTRSSERKRPTRRATSTDNSDT